MPFEIGKPAAGGGIQLKDHVGALIVFVGTSLEANINTAFGPTNAARVQVVVPLDGPSAGEVYSDCLVFGKVIVPSLTNSDSDIVVGRLVMGAAKAGQNAPFMLEDPTEEEVKSVLAWLEQNIAENANGRYFVKNEAGQDAAKEAPFQ
jgi:hypothetical protein